MEKKWLQAVTGYKVDLTLAMAIANELQNGVEEGKSQKQVVIIVKKRKVRGKQEREKNNKQDQTKHGVKTKRSSQFNNVMQDNIS
jgi:hypothetical protein